MCTACIYVYCIILFRFQLVCKAMMKPWFSPVVFATDRVQLPATGRCAPIHPVGSPCPAGGDSDVIYRVTQKMV